MFNSKFNKMKKENYKCGNNSSCFYGLGFVGAAIYFISTATSFWFGVLGFFKAIVWPAFFVYEGFKYLGI